MAWLIRMLVAVAAGSAAAWGQPTAHGAGPSGLAAIAAIALAAAIVALLARGYRPGPALSAGPLLRRAIALRRKSWSAVFQRQRNPDAAGRPRPRAPGAAPAAA
jgi:hypothetical protein